MVRVRRASALVFELVGSGLVATHYVARRTLSIEELSLRILRRAEGWVCPEEIFEHEGPREQVAAELIRLIDGGLVIVEGTRGAEDDERFVQSWEWGAGAGAFHFGLRGARYEGTEGIARHMAERAATRPRVPLSAQGDAPDVVSLEVPPLDHPVLSALRRRRSRRAFGEAPLPLGAVADCLFGGLAVVGRARAADEWLPLKMAPSGGARNPFDGLLYAWNVEGLARGLYRYLPETHGLAPVATSSLPEISALVGGQAWFAGAGAVLLLVANVRRTMWKYPHPTGLRVILLEAGHIAQNMLVCAAHHGLAAAPTCAVSDLVLEDLCGLDPFEQAVLHTVVLGAPGGPPSEVDFDDIEPNEAFPGWLDRGPVGR